MKRLVIAALAIGAMAACTKSTVQYEQPGEISLQPVAQKATKAAVDGSEYPTTESFNVWAWWGDHPAATPLISFTTTTPYIAKGTFVHRSNGSWGGLTPYYWPTKGSLVFAGYSPASANATNFNYNLVDKKFTVEDFIQSNKIDKTVDLMWFDVTEKSYNDNANKNTQNQDVNGVPVVFQHALSWLTFKFYLKESTTPEYWTIKSVVLKGIETTADFTASTTNTAWTTPTDAPTEGITVYSNTTGHLVKKTYDTDDDAILENTRNGVLIIPQSCAPSNGTNPADAELVITYDLKSPTGQILTDQNVSLPLNGTNINENKWEPGKHYTYNITFGAREILIAPSVTGWTEIDIPVEK